MQRATRSLDLGVIILLALLGSGAPRLFGPPPAARAAGRTTRNLSLPRLASAPSPSGAYPAYPLNNTFNGDVVQTGTPPANSDFETPPQTTGTPPANSDFSAASTVAGSPPTNSNFATGDFTGWTVSGSPTVASDPSYGHYASLNGAVNIISSPFTVDPSTQVLTFMVDTLTSGGSYFNVWILSGPGYTTSKNYYLTTCSCPTGTWSPETLDFTAYRGQSVEVQFAPYYSAVGLTDVLPMVALPDYTTSGPVARALDANQNPYAAIPSGQIISSPFTLDPTASMASVSIMGLASESEYEIDLLTGPTFTTDTELTNGFATQNTWTPESFAIGAWAGQHVELLVKAAYNGIGVDHVGLQQASVPGWSATGTVTEVGGGPTGQYVSLHGGNLTSSPFTLDPRVQQLSLSYADGGNSEFQVLLLSGQGFGTQTNLTNGYLLGQSTWQTLQLAVQAFAGQTVELQIQQYFGTGLYDNAGLPEQEVPGWTLTSEDAVLTGADSQGTYVTPAGGAFNLQSSPIDPGIITPSGGVGERSYTITYAIGYATGNLLQVYFTNTNNQGWDVFQDAADNPTGVRTATFALDDFMGTQGVLSIHLSGGGRVYSIGDNVARQQLAEPFSQKVGLSVDTTTGAFAFSDHDLGTADGPLPLDYTRFYNAQSATLGELGYRWSGTYDIRLRIAPNGDTGVDWGSGQEEYFLWNRGTSGVFAPADARIHDTLVKNGDGSLTLTTTSNRSYHFTSMGQLSSIADLNGNTLTLAYNGSQQLVSVTDPGGRSLTFAYNPNGTCT